MRGWQGRLRTANLKSVHDHRVRCTDFEFSINDQSDYQTIIRDSDSFSSHFGSRGRLAVDVVARTVPI